MSFLIKTGAQSDCKPSEITPKEFYAKRRQFIKNGLSISASLLMSQSFAEDNACKKIIHSSNLLKLTDLHSITNYNNYYEFSTEKEAIAVLAQAFTTEPWTINIGGAVEKPFTLDLTSLNQYCQVERTYRLRCVEGWSMVIPWLGIPLIEVIKKAKPLSKAKFVRFIGTERPGEMIGQRRGTLTWPYTEALRIDEAVHPLTLLATGLYGESLPKQNGAPIRLVVPWKYGFKSIKAIQKIEFLEDQPTTTWMESSPKEYGFYANVNPDVAHPRWSQRREVRIGETKKIKTLPFNGYASEVSHLYTGMDLQKHF